MLAEQRRKQILDILGQKGAVSVTELYRQLRVSRETVRRDIARLARENRLQKTHGGILSLDAAEPSFSERLRQNIEGKRLIGRAAAAMVQDGTSVVIGNGTTALCVAEALAVRRRLTVITNDVHVAGRLAGRNENRVLMTGGELQGTGGAMFGRDATAMMANYVGDVAFVAASAIDANPWLLDYTREAAELNAVMLASARTAVLLADHTKFGRTAPVRVANLEKVQHILCDRLPSDDMAQALARLPAGLIVAERQASAGELPASPPRPEPFSGPGEDTDDRD